MCVYVYIIYILIIFYHPYIHITILIIIIYHLILATICTLCGDPLCEAPESNNIDSGTIQINCIIIIIIMFIHIQELVTQQHYL